MVSASSAKSAANFPLMIAANPTGDAASDDHVPLRRSSTTERMEIAGATNNTAQPSAMNVPRKVAGAPLRNTATANTVPASAANAAITLHPSADPSCMRHSRRATATALRINVMIALPAVIAVRLMRAPVQQ